MSPPGCAVWRLLDDVDRHRFATDQMAADLEMLEAVLGGGPPMLRCYRWVRPALSIGRFQPDTDVDQAACARWGVEVVRRPTGGRAVLHGGDLTYAVAMPVPPGAAGTVDAVHARIAAALVAGLAHLGVRAEIARHQGGAGPACMATQQGADLRVGERKVCGSAQVRRGGVLLQHGSILCTRLDVDETDLLHGAPDRVTLRAATVTLAELGAPHDPHVVAAAVIEGFRRVLDVELTSTAPGDRAAI